MRAGLSGVMPEPLGRIEVRRVGRQREDFDVAVVFGKEFQDFRFLMIRGVVLNQIDPMAAAVIMGQQVSIHERQISVGVEVFGLVPPDKIAGGHADRPQDFLRVAFSARGNLRLLTAPRPSALERGRLSKGRFIFVNDHRPFALGVFFRFGWV